MFGQHKPSNPVLESLIGSGPFQKIIFDKIRNYFSKEGFSMLEIRIDPSRPEPTDVIVGGHKGAVCIVSGQSDAQDLTDDVFFVQKCLQYRNQIIKCITDYEAKYLSNGSDVSKADDTDRPDSL